jgi:hypothetical protein
MIKAGAIDEDKRMSTLWEMAATIRAEEAASRNAVRKAQIRSRLRRVRFNYSQANTSSVCRQAPIIEEEAFGENSSGDANGFAMPVAPTDS